MSTRAFYLAICFFISFYAYPEDSSQILTNMTFKEVIAEEKRLDLEKKQKSKNILLPLTTKKSIILPDCTPYLDMKKNDGNLDSWKGKICGDGTNYPMDASTLIGFSHNGNSINSDWMIDILNQELHRDSFLVAWKERDFFRKLYPDISYKKSERKAKECGLEIAKCRRKEWKCSGDFLKEELEKEKFAKKPRPMDEKTKKAYLAEQVRRALLVSANIQGLKYINQLGDKDQRDYLKEQFQFGIDSIRVESPLLFKEEVFKPKRMWDSAIKSISQLFKASKSFHEESELTKLILKEIDPLGKRSRKYLRMVMSGDSSKENIVEEIFMKGIGDNAKSVDDFISDKSFMKKVDRVMKKMASNHIDILAKSAELTCKKRNDTKPYIHHFPEIVERTLKRMENEYQQTSKNKDSFDYYNTRIKAGYCFAKDKYPSVDAEVSKLLVMGAVATSAGLVALPFSEGTSSVLVVVGGALSVVGAKDAWVSDSNLLEIYGNKYAKTKDMEEYYKVAGYNNAFVGFDAGMFALEGIFLVRKIGKNIMKLKEMDVFTGTLKNVPQQDRNVLWGVYNNMRKNPEFMDDEIMRELLLEAEKNIDVKQTLFLVLKKEKENLEEAGQFSGITEENLLAELSKKLKKCVLSKKSI